MFNYKLVISYDGSKYKGWQRLGDTDKTVQGKIESVLSKLLEKKIEIFGASRTDAGVHARGQVASFHLDEVLDCKDLLEALNRYLPEDIMVLELSEASEKFHCRYNASGKTYVYQIWNATKIDPFQRQYYTLVRESLDIKAMRQAAALFVGEHDFTTFTSAKAKKKSMVRKVTSVHVEQEEEKVFIRVAGEGFLHNQVRRMVGVLIDIGLGNRKPEVIPSLIAAKDRAKCGTTAPANGLFLEKIKYN